MSLLEKLREDRASALETIEGLENEIAPLEQAREFWTQMVADYDIAIAALEPVAEQEDPGLREVRAYTSGRLDGYQQAMATQASSQPAPPIVDEPVEFISDLTGDPAIEPESGLHGEPVPQPEWNEPEGYAPVTNPDAQAHAKALDYYSPEKIAERNRFNPFAVFRREPEGV